MKKKNLSETVPSSVSTEINDEMNLSTNDDKKTRNIFTHILKEHMRLSSRKREKTAPRFAPTQNIRERRQRTVCTQKSTNRRVIAKIFDVN